MWEPPALTVLVQSLEDPTHPIGMRMRAAYYLRQAYLKDKEEGSENPNKNGDPVVGVQETVLQALTQGLLNEKHGSLMRHEFAYIMGQIRDDRCCPQLEQVLMNDQDCCMVRHEAAEALGAIGASRSAEVLQKVMESTTPDLPEVSDTCRLALALMAWRAAGSDPAHMPALLAGCSCMHNPYYTVDPAPPKSEHAQLPLSQLGDILCDASLPMFERYRAMFSLRNMGGAEAVEQLCRALTTDTSSALLRHEVAYVLGQMAHPSSVEALEQSLGRIDEHKMVRHESAESLGAIEGRWQDVERILSRFAQDDNEVVRESCLVALDAADYWGHNKDGGEEEEEQEGGQDDPQPPTFTQQKADHSVVQ